MIRRVTLPLQEKIHILIETFNYLHSGRLNQIELATISSPSCVEIFHQLCINVALNRAEYLRRKS